LLLGNVGGVPGELPPAGTRPGLNWLVLVVDLPVLAFEPVPEEAVPQPARSAAAARAAIGPATRRGLSRARSRLGAPDGL
jgi:hypothetical protein